MGLFNFISENKIKKAEIERQRIIEEENHNILEQKRVAEEAENNRLLLLEQAESKRLLEIQQAKNREIAKQKKEAKRQVAKRLLANEKPLAIVSVSKIGQINKFHEYELPYNAEIGDFVVILLETQFHDDNDKDREAYVVSFDNYAIGEINESSIDHITQAGADIEDILGVISKIDINAEPPKMSISIYMTESFNIL